VQILFRNSDNLDIQDPFICGEGNMRKKMEVGDIVATK
jgi:hypothetical protein